MDTTADELAGVVDLFGGLTREELERALSEAAYRADGQSVDEAALEDAIEDGLESFTLVRCDAETVRGEENGFPQDDLFVSGPAAFPQVPEYATDVPHILDIEPRQLDRERLGEIAVDLFSKSIDELRSNTDERTSGVDDRRRYLLDVSYDIEAWAPVELSEQRRRLETELE